MARPAQTSNSQTISNNPMKKSKLAHAQSMIHGSVKELKVDAIHEEKLMKKSSISNSNGPFLKMGNSYDEGSATNLLKNKKPELRETDKETHLLSLGFSADG